jgi:thiamine-monophosphate kinase
MAVTAFGDLEGRAPVLRSGARIGDVVTVSGVLGAAAAGLRMLFSQATVDGAPDAVLALRVRHEHPEVAAQLAPTPPVADGRLAALAGATAMIDLSDGLALDARRIAQASGVALDLSLASVGSREALVGGEDHSLLATFPADTILPGGFRVIGVVTDGSGVLVDSVPFEARGGWDPYEEWDGEDG